MRKFWIENEKGERRALNGESGIWLEDPYGLGMTRGFDFANLKRGFFRIVSSDADPQSVGGGTLVFRSRDPYGDYLVFTTWLARSSELHLIYDPHGNSGTTESELEADHLYRINQTTLGAETILNIQDANDPAPDRASSYMRDIEITEIVKGELSAPTWLKVTISWASSCPWYRATPVPIEFIDPSKDSWRCDTTGSLIGSAIIVDNYSSGRSGSIQPGGQIEASFVLRCEGAISNPLIRLVGESGTVYGSVTVLTAIPSGGAIVLDTRDGRRGIWKEINGERTGLLGSVEDLTKVIFPTIPMTESCALQVETEAIFTGVCSALVYEWYRTV